MKMAFSTEDVDVLDWSGDTQTLNMGVVRIRNSSIYDSLDDIRRVQLLWDTYGELQLDCELCGPVALEPSSRRDDNDLVIEDGHGHSCTKCERSDCGLEYIKPGKTQCWCDNICECGNEIEYFGFEDSPFEKMSGSICIKCQSAHSKIKDGWKRRPNIHLECQKKELLGNYEFFEGRENIDNLNDLFEIIRDYSKDNPDKIKLEIVIEGDVK